MSVTTADINNDLSKEIYLGQIDRGNGAVKTLDIEKICSAVKNEKHRGHCKEIFKRQKLFTNSIIKNNYESCPDEYKADCIAIEMIQNRKRISFLESAVCEYLPDSWDGFNWLCNYQFIEGREHSNIQKPTIDIQQFGGIILEKNTTGFYENKTDQYGISTIGWAWNSKFADVDNDEYQDLFIANGYLIKPLQESNIFYQNNRGENFIDKTKESGLENYLPTSSYSYVDYDLDGDIDIIAATAVGPVFVYTNNNHKNNSISIQLQDEIGNYYGIGAKVYIYYGNGKHQMREVLASGGYKSFDAPVSHFGLGEYKQLDKIVVVWEDGKEIVIEQSLEAGANYLIYRK
jgi:hypothetical protein